MEIFIALAVIVIILLGALVMTLARLAAAAAAISSGVARIGTEVTETTAAIRAHLEGDSGISQTALLEQVEKLETAGAALTEAANSLDSLQTELGANSGGGEPAADAPASDVPASDVPASDDLGGGSDAPASDVPASDVDPAVTGDAAGSGDDSTFGNQNGVGSEFEQTAGGGAIETGRPASDGDDGLGGGSDAPASDAPADDTGFGRP